MAAGSTRSSRYPRRIRSTARSPKRPRRQGAIIASHQSIQLEPRSNDAGVRISLIGQGRAQARRMRKALPPPGRRTWRETAANVLGAVFAWWRRFRRAADARAIQPPPLRAPARRAVIANRTLGRRRPGREHHFVGGECATCPRRRSAGCATRPREMPLGTPAHADPSVQPDQLGTARAPNTRPYGRRRPGDQDNPCATATAPQGANKGARSSPTCDLGTAHPRSRSTAGLGPNGASSAAREPRDADLKKIRRRSRTTCTRTDGCRPLAEVLVCASCHEPEPAVRR